MANILYESSNHVAYLTIQSPPANALSTGLIESLAENLDKAEQDAGVKAIVIKGDGKFFSAGADIKEFTSLENAADYQSLSENGQKLFDRIEHYPIPVIAAIHGAALGGGLELAMSCHMRIAAEETKLGLPELTLGIIPGFAGTQRLPRYVGSAKAYEMILTGQPITAEEAKASGLVNRVVRTEDLIEETTRLAENIAAKSRGSINAIMKLLPYSYTDQFSTGVKAEAESFAEVFGSADAKEGVQAFLEKREPDFQDK
ncbi:enoyl-CoA hydratase [Virgibacillus xinjiangensis]|uniref:Enoyl-CoA hydratase n=1 Tax=Virgibacillus xinjiangensis TaxID=393090 RepID=A0ABV7CUN2_9BACI